MIMRKVLIGAAATVGLAMAAGIAPLLAEEQQEQRAPTIRQDGAATSSQGEPPHPEQNVQSTGNAHLSHERAAKIAHTLMATASPQDINMDVAVGSDLPGDADVRALPPAVVQLAPEYRGYEYVVAHNEIFIVHPSTRRVVEVIREGE
jgi:Protein of unknown function (DUF1236)